MGYLIWYRLKHKRAKRLNTFESLWKFLRQLHYDKTQQEMPKLIGKQVTDVGIYLNLKLIKAYCISSICITNSGTSTILFEA